MASEQKRAKRHHLVPQVYLRAWADIDDRVQVLDRESKKRFVSSVSNVALQGNFFTFDTEDGPTDAVERMLAEIEGLAAPIIVRMADGQWPLSDDDRGVLANLLRCRSRVAPRSVRSRRTA